MDCTAPGQFPAERLLAFAGGELDEPLALHLPTCAACTEAVAGYGAADRALRSLLYRAECSSTEELGELALDLVEPARATIVRAHLAGCPHCGAEFTALRGALRQDPLLDLVPRPSPLRRLVARLLSLPAEVMAYGMVDTGESGSPRIYEAEDVRVSLALEHADHDAGDVWILRGAMVSGDTESDLSGGTAHLLLNGRQILETPVDQPGTFVAAGLISAGYDLELHLGNRLVVVESLPVGAEWGHARS